MPAPKPKLSRLNDNQPNYMLLGNQHKVESKPIHEHGAAAGPAVADSSTSEEDCKDFSVFKAQARFVELNDAIAHSENVLKWLGMALAIVLGLLDLILVIAYWVIPKNCLIDWAERISGDGKDFS